MIINKQVNFMFARPYNGLLISFIDSHQDFMQIEENNSTRFVSSFDDRKKIINRCFIE
jgi:hypothetical protein